MIPDSSQHWEAEIGASRQSVLLLKNIEVGLSPCLLCFRFHPSRASPLLFPFWLIYMISGCGLWRREMETEA